MLGNGRYVVGPLLGVGAMGAVYEAEDLVRTERVAIKIAHDEGIAADIVASHMQRELQIGRSTSHPNVIGILDGGVDRGQPFVVMELALGRPLSMVLAEDVLTIGRIVDIVGQILCGLGAIHDGGYVHGDVKTDNVLVATAADGSDVVKMIDLGLACEQSDAAGPRTARLVSGTPDYLAPEVALGGVKTVASDLYAVGVVLYELLTGRPPFASDDFSEVLRAQVEDEVVPPSLRRADADLPRALDEVVLRALDKRPDSRYRSGAELGVELQRATKSCRDARVHRRDVAPRTSTATWTRPAPPTVRRLALGTTPPPVAHGDRAERIVETALETTRSLLAAHRLTAARDELEAALRLVDGEDECDLVAWRLLLPLAAICEALHDAYRARDLARRGLECAVRARSTIGRQRAKALIERLAGHRQPRPRS